jgi:hypothetical protein
MKLRVYYPEMVTSFAQFMAFATCAPRFAKHKSPLNKLWGANEGHRFYTEFSIEVTLYCKNKSWRSKFEVRWALQRDIIIERQYYRETIQQS